MLNSLLGALRDKPMYATISCNTAHMCCGVVMIHSFRDLNYGEVYTPVTKEVLEEMSGAQLFQAGFRKGEPVDDKMFAHLANICDVEYVSPVRKNTNSGNMFYTAIFSLPEKK
jgi:hypothetical protein